MTDSTMPAIVFPAKADDTEKQELQTLAARYWAVRDNQQDVKNLAADVGRSYRSLVMTLVRAGVYQKMSYTGKDGKPTLKKDAIVDALAERVNFTTAEANSLTSANKSALAKILAALKTAE